MIWCMARSQPVANLIYTTRGLKSYIIPRHKLGWTFCGHKYLKSRFVVAILNFSKSTCTFPEDYVIVQCELLLTSIFQFLRPQKISMAAIWIFSKTLTKSLAHLHIMGNVFAPTTNFRVDLWWPL